MNGAEPVAVGLIGAGWIGAFHGESLARRIWSTRLAAIADPAPGAAERLADRLGCERTCTDAAELLADPGIEAVVIAAPPKAHADLVVAAARAGKSVFCEKPMAVTLAGADRAIAATREAGVVLQVGFNRRFDRSFRAAHERIAAGHIGTPQLLRSLTRDPGIPDPSRVPRAGIFLETLIHDFDTLRYLNPGAEVVDVYAVADALAYPQYKAQGLQDTAVVVMRFDNGAIATAEANFNAAYGYDIRGEAFGSRGMVTAGDLRRTTMTFYGRDGVVSEGWQRNVDLFHDAYVAELVAFAARVRDGAPGGSPHASTGDDARAALAIALAAIQSAETGTPVRLDEIDAVAG